MGKLLERNTIFLYPNYKKERSDLALKIHQLVTDITSIVENSNELINQMLCGGSFSNIKCMPNVIMQSIDDYNYNSLPDYNNVRICIANSYGIDFTESYENVITKYHTGDLDISHLVAIHIKKQGSKVIFQKDQSKKFDIIIETDLEHLDNVLIAIMLDVSLYHYFSLNKDLSKRKQFNKLKFKYLFNNINNFKSIYGNEFLEDDEVYLPFSFQDINTLKKCTHVKKQIKAIKDLIRKYAEFLIESLSIKIELNKHKSIKNPYALNNLENYEYLIEFIETFTFKCNSNILIVPKEKSTEISAWFMLEYNYNDSNIQWADKLSNCENGYYIYKIEIEVK